MKRRSRLLTAALAISAVFALNPSGANAAVSVSIAPDAKLVDAGTVVARVTVACDRGDQVLEAHLTVSQDDQRISGTAGIGGVRCDGKQHRFRVRVTPQEGSFHTGDAFASAFVLVLDPATGMTEQGQATATIAIK
jgi:hypothetical protein